MKRKINRIKLFLLSLFLIFLSARTVWAEMEIDWPTSPVGEDLTPASTLADLTKYLYEWGIAIGILIFFGTLIYAGLQYLASTGDPQKMTSARKKVVSSFAGIILLLGSYLILNTINPELTQIGRIQPSLGHLSNQHFSVAPDSEMDLTDFALLHTTQEDGEEETFLTIPGTSFAFEEGGLFPENSRACKPKKNEDLIWDVRTVVEMSDSGEEVEYLALFTRSGERVEQYDKIEADGENTSQEDIQELYAERYERIDTTLTLGEENEYLRNAWLNQSDRGLYNSINSTQSTEDLCELVITQSDFQRPRCIEVEILDNGEEVEITEWRRRGVASLLDALDYLQDDTDNSLFNQPMERSCPSAEEIYGNPEREDLGYERDPTGGGSNHAFYKGDKMEVFKWWPFSFEMNLDTCSEQISRSSADMNSYRGVVDDEVTCIEHIRDDEPIEVKELKFDLWLINATGRYDCEDDHESACANREDSWIEVSIPPIGEKVEAPSENFSKVIRKFEIPAYAPVTIRSEAQVVETANHALYELSVKGEGRHSSSCNTTTTGDDGETIQANCSFNMQPNMRIRLSDGFDLDMNIGSGSGGI